MSLVLFEPHPNGVGHLILNDAERLNAMGEDMAAAFESAVRDASRTSLRALVVRANGRAFSAGGNLDMLEARRKHDLGANRAYMLGFYQSFLGLRDLGVPLVAALQGHCVGAGACLALACDMRLAAPDCKMAFSFTRLGLHPGMGSTWFLPRLVGPAHAADLLLTGRTVKADEALAMGLISRLVDADLVGEAQSVANAIAANGPVATGMLVSTLRQGLPGLTQALQAEATAQAVSYNSDEFAEGMAAARDKRPPAFKS